MGYLPVAMDVAGRRCLVVGGGRVATHRVELLVAAGAEITVISPKVTDRIRGLCAEGRIEVRLRSYSRGDLRGVCLAFDATDDETVHERVAAEASDEGVMLNVADKPERCDFIMPAILRRGDLTVAVSTSGRCPALAAKIREALEELFGPEYTLVVAILGRVREALSHLPKGERELRLRKLVDSPLPLYVSRGDTGAVDRLLAEAVAQDLSLARLGIIAGG